MGVKLEIENIQVLPESLNLLRLWHHDSSTLEGPSESDLTWSLVVLLSRDSQLTFMQEGSILLTTGAELAELTVGHDLHAIHLGEAEQSLLGHVRVHFNLQNSWLNLGVLDDVLEFVTADVTHANILDKSLLNEFFHSGPCLLVSDGQVELHSGLVDSGVMDPAGGTH